MQQVVGLGITVIDHLLITPHYPAVNSKNIVKKYLMQGGGPVPTALAVLGKFGIKCSLISKIGKDEVSDFLQHELANYHVDYKHVIHDEECETPESFVVIDERNGDRTIFLYRGGHAEILPHDIPDRVIQKSRLLHLDGRDVDAAIYAAQVAKAHDTLVSIDIGSDRHIPHELLQLVNIAIVSETFSHAQLLKDNPLKSAEMLLDFGIDIAAVTCGQAGSYWATKDQLFHQSALPIQAVDTTGAGDVFHGAALYGILKGYTLTQTARFASATAALACQKIGGKAGIPELDDIQSLYNSEL